MNYLLEIKAFYERLQVNPLSTGQIALWHALMNINNKCAWREWFTVPNITLELNTGLTRQSIVKSRNLLKQLGYIDFRTNSTKATSYKMLTMLNNLQDSLQVGLQDSLQDSLPLNKQNINNNISIPQNKFEDDYSSNTLFLKFWEAYPKKVDKHNAFKAFCKLKVDDGLLSVILNAIDEQKTSKQWQDKQFIPYPSSWLNGHHWEDETEERVPEEGTPYTVKGNFIQIGV